MPAWRQWQVVRLDRHRSQQQDGLHERMHRGLKVETARPPLANRHQPQARFDRFRDEYIQVRTHEALGRLVEVPRAAAPRQRSAGRGSSEFQTSSLHPVRRAGATRKRGCRRASRRELDLKPPAHILWLPESSAYLGLSTIRMNPSFQQIDYVSNRKFNWWGGRDTLEHVQHPPLGSEVRTVGVEFALLEPVESF